MFVKTKKTTKNLADLAKNNAFKKTKPKIQLQWLNKLKNLDKWQHQLPFPA